MTALIYKTSDFTYELYEVKPNISYDDSHQQIYVNANNTLIISGGQLNVEYHFRWNKSSSEGWEGFSGMGYGVSDSIDIWKQIRIENKREINFHLVKSDNISFTKGKAIPTDFYFFVP